MHRAILNNKDFWAGVMLLAVGGTAAFIARDYPFGTTLRMGPGYVPTVLGGLLALFGLYFIAKGFRSTEVIEGNWSLRALIVLPLSFGLFGVVIEYAGFIPALIVLVFGSAAASREFRFVEVALLTVVMIAQSVTVFIWGLGLPYPPIAG